MLGYDTTVENTKKIFLLFSISLCEWVVCRGQGGQILSLILLQDQLVVTL